jgi:succinate dehydrogenase / fumarate reductase cytochrome b subunit
MTAIGERTAGSGLLGTVRRFGTSSIGKKQLLALTGLGLAGFLIAHLAGNLLIFRGPEAFNEYSHALVSNPLIYAAEAALAGLFVVHIALALKLTRENRAARGPERYAMVRSRGRPSRRSFASQTMVYSGLLAFAFLVLHLMTFKYNVDIAGLTVAPIAVRVHGGVEMRDLYARVIQVFHEPAYVGWYLFSMLVLGLHLSHGASSLFETLGLDHPRWTPAIRLGGRIFAWAIALGFASIPGLVILGVGAKP